MQGLDILTLMFYNLGDILENFSDISEGYVWGNWPEGDEYSRFWMGIPVRVPVFGWAGYPKFIDSFNRNVWKHQCFSINFESGMLRYVLNGKKIFSVNNIYNEFKEDIQPFSPRKVLLRTSENLCTD